MVFLLDTALIQETVSIFIYSWTFLEVSVSELQKGKCKTMLLYYRIGTIFVFPLLSYTLFFCWNVSFANLNYYFYHPNVKKFLKANKNLKIFNKCLLAWNFILILVSCFHLGFFIWQLRNMTKRINQQYLHSETKAKVKINVLTTSIHILVIFSLASIYSMGIINIRNKTSYTKILTSSVFLVGIQDLFVICMLWLVMDSHNKPLF